MVLGFSGFGVSIFSAQIGLGTSAAPKTIRALLSCAALCMVGAGLFTLNNAAELHIALIAAAFMLLVISMYLLPISVSKFSSLSSRAASWLFAGGTTVSVALGGRIPEGITQRTAVLCIIAWLIWVGTRIFSAEEMMPNHCR